MTLQYLAGWRAGPRIPDARLAAAFLALIPLGSGLATVVGRPSHDPGEPGRTGLWMALSLLACGIAWLAIPAQRLVDRRVLPLATSGLVGWAAFLAIAFVFAGAGAGSRLLLGPLLIDPAWFPDSAGRDLSGTFVLTIVVYLLVLERYSALLARYVGRRAALVALEENLESSRTRLVREDDAMRKEAAEILHGEVQTRLLVAWDLLGQAQAAIADGCAGSREVAAALAEEASQHLSEVSRSDLDRARRRLVGSASASRLPEGIRELVARFGTVLEVALSGVPHLDGSAHRVPEALASATLRLVQEALLNALRHGLARRVSIAADRTEEGALSICVRDDGKGYDRRDAPRGLGLQTLGQSLVAAGGGWLIRSAPGAGTHVEIMLPLSALPEEAPLAS